MTDFCDFPDAIDCWRATIDGLETIIVQPAAEAPQPASEIDQAEADEIRHLIMVHVAARRRSTLPAAWVRRARIVLPDTPADAKPNPELRGPADPRARPRQAWRE